MANKAVVCARLVIDGQDYGIQFFYAPIRDEETHLPLKGLEIGDLGPKFGYDSKDNGFIVFTHYRIPRTNLVS